MGFPFLLCGFLFLHLFYLHFLSSNNPLRNSTWDKIPFFPFIFLKDFFGLILILCLYFLQTHFHVSSLSHPDNALEASALLTPLHIVPEWYFSFKILFLSSGSYFSLDRCSIPSREVSILWSYLDITLLFSSYVYLIFILLLAINSFLFFILIDCKRMKKDRRRK